LKDGKVEEYDGGQFLELSGDVYYLLGKVPIYPLCSSVNVITTCVILFLRMKISVVGVLLAIWELGKPSLVIIYFIAFHNNV